LSNIIRDSRITHIKIECSALSGGAGHIEDTLLQFGGFGQQSNVRLSSGGITENWYKVINQPNAYQALIAINSMTRDYYLRKVIFLGRGTNIHFT
jgi:hypothetical protein